MKELWVKVIPWDKSLVTAALESGADAVVVPEGKSEKVHELGIIKTVAPDGDLELGKDVAEVEIRGKADEEEALRLSRSRTVIVRTDDWTIIPLENLIAQTEQIMAEVKDDEEARTALQILERGVRGVVLVTRDINVIKRTAALVKQEAGSIALETARIISCESLGMGDRVCIDTCTRMGVGEGILVGNTGDGMFLVHSESVENPYVAARPFRVNAGALHAYTLGPGGRTSYLSDLKAGDGVLVVSADGRSQPAVVGRAKVERRPLLLVKAETGGSPISLILQNAETIRLTAPDGNPVSVVALEPGTEVLVYRTEAGRHFGIKIEETIVEK